MSDILVLVPFAGNDIRCMSCIINHTSISSISFLQSFNVNMDFLKERSARLSAGLQVRVRIDTWQQTRSGAWPGSNRSRSISKRCAWLCVCMCVREGRERESAHLYELSRESARRSNTLHLAGCSVARTIDGSICFEPPPYKSSQPHDMRFTSATE